MSHELYPLLITVSSTYLQQPLRPQESTLYLPFLGLSQVSAKVSPWFIRSSSHYTPNHSDSRHSTRKPAMPLFYNMPAFQRQVSFDADPVYSRPARDDEVYVMKGFARHCSHCSRCADPYEASRRGDGLCDKGRARAQRVAEYVYSKGDQAYSKVDSEGNQRVQIEIPAGCQPVRGLLKAMERGLLRRTSKPVSYDSTYYVPARRPLSSSTTARLPKPRLETAEAPRYPSPLRRGDSKRYVGRGSLYEADMKEREEASYKAPIYYRIAPKVPTGYRE